MRLLLFILIAIQSTLTLAQEPITPKGAPIVVYQVTDQFESIKSNLEIAITGRGMLISKTLHISDMFDRTAADTGLANTVYSKAEAFEFCNIKLSWQMSRIHPGNLSICPLTIGIYSLQKAPGKVFISYRRPTMLGKSDKEEQTLTHLFEGIIKEAIE